MYLALNIGKTQMNKDFLFKNTPEQLIQLESIISKMHNSGLPSTFVQAAKNLAENDQGVFDLMELWYNETDENEKKLIINDINGINWDYVCSIVGR